jgi:hypothetical protein
VIEALDRGIDVEPLGFPDAVRALAVRMSVFEGSQPRSRRVPPSVRSSGRQAKQRGWSV